MPVYWLSAAPRSVTAIGSLLIRASRAFWYGVTPKISLSLDYRYFSTLDPKFTFSTPDRDRLGQEPIPSPQHHAGLGPSFCAASAGGRRTPAAARAGSAASGSAVRGARRSCGMACRTARSPRPGAARRTRRCRRPTACASRAIGAWRSCSRSLASILGILRTALALEHLSNDIRNWSPGDTKNWSPVDVNGGERRA